MSQILIAAALFIATLTITVTIAGTASADSPGYPQGDVTQSLRTK